jgi:hypothetical protein
MHQRKIAPGGNAAGQASANEQQIAFLRSLVDEHGAARAAKRAGLSQLTMMRVIAGLPVLRGTLALVDAAPARAAGTDGPISPRRRSACRTRDLQSRPPIKRRRPEKPSALPVLVALLLAGVLVLLIWTGHTEHATRVILALIDAVARIGGNAPR